MRLKTLVAAMAFLSLTPLPLAAAGWEDTTAAARGKVVYWNAWAGDPRINDYIGWVGGQVRERYGIDLRHVKVTDTADVVSRVLAEKAAGKDQGGSVDLVWINGENFAAMKENRLLYGPFVDRLPNARLIDTVGKPTTVVDFTIPTEGLESPWGMAQFVFTYDTEQVAKPPKSAAALLDWAKANPGRFTYPSPPDFIGSTFLKQMLVEVTPDPAKLQKPVEDADFDKATAPLWSFLDQLHPNLARSGTELPGDRAGAEADAGRRRGRHGAQLPSRRSVPRYRERVAAGVDPHFRARPGDHRQHAFRRHSLQRQRSGRRHGGGELPAVA